MTYWPDRTSRLLLPVLWCLLTLVVAAACSPLSPLGDRGQVLVPLRLETPPTPETDEPVFQRLTLANPRIGAALSERELLYIEENFQRRAYSRSVWGAPLSNQIADLTADYLSQSGLSSVVNRQLESGPRLEIEILEWLHDYRGPSPQVQLTIRTTLRDGDEARQWRYDERRDFSPAGVVPGLAVQQELFEEWLAELRSWLVRLRN